MLPEILCTFFVIFNKIKVQGTYCETYSNSWPYESNRITYCDPSQEKCCDTGCCPLQPTQSTDLTSFWVILTIIGIYFTCFGIYICHRKCGQSVATDYTPPPNSNIENNRFASEIVSNLLTDQGVHRQVVNIAGSEDVTPPPSYEAAISAPPLYTDSTIPSYEDVMRGK